MSRTGFDTVMHCSCSCASGPVAWWPSDLMRTADGVCLLLALGMMPSMPLCAVVWAALVASSDCYSLTTVMGVLVVVMAKAGWVAGWVGRGTGPPVAGPAAAGFKVLRCSREGSEKRQWEAERQACTVRQSARRAHRTPPRCPQGAADVRAAHQA